MKPEFFDFPQRINGLPTAVEVLSQHWDAVSKRWNDDTAEQYVDYYRRIILPHFAARPLESYADVQAYEDLFQKISSIGTIRDPDGGQYSPATLQKFRHLIKVVLKVAAEVNMCPDVLWGTDFSLPEDEDPDEAEAHARTRLRKSLMPEEEYALADLVFVDSTQDGEYMFAILSLATGGRPQEIADLRFGDVISINPAKNQYGIAILTTVCGKSSKRGGKTRNMYRIIPISKRLYRFLEERKAAVIKTISEAQKAQDSESLMEPIVPVEELFICCAGKNFFARCDLKHASNVCRDLLRRIGIKESLMRFFEKEASRSDDESVWGKEKLVTSYILRRHFCTLAYLLSLSETEILYLMGHSMDHLITKRSDFRYSPFMSTLCDKLSLRPIMNPLPDWDANAFLVTDQPASKTYINVPLQNITLDGSATGGTLTITITPNEANDPIRINFKTAATNGAPITINGTHQTALAHGVQRKNISVISDVLQMYRRAQASIGSDSAFIKKYEQREDTDTSDHNFDLDDSDSERR